MSYDELLTARIHIAISPQLHLGEMKMFGGIGFLVNGNPSTGLRQAQPGDLGQAWEQHGKRAYFSE